jgi:imidazolonepropionase-like amidohydrolase
MKRPRRWVSDCLTRKLLKAVTLYPAQIWGVGDELGSIEKGKWADLIVTDGDPLETRTQIKQMYIKGAP